MYVCMSNSGANNINRAVSSRKQNYVIYYFSHTATMLVHMLTAIGCLKCSHQDKDASFHRIPAVIRHTDKRDFELTKKRREGFLLLFPEQISILMHSII